MIPMEDDLDRIMVVMEAGFDPDKDLFQTPVMPPMVRPGPGARWKTP